jgi:hypothetical protein
MAAAVGKYAARKVLNSQMKKYAKKEPAGQYVRSPINIHAPWATVY